MDDTDWQIDEMNRPILLGETGVTTTSVYDKSELIELIHKHALKFGEFKLASGQIAPFYLDCRKLTLTGEGANMVAAGILAELADDWPHAVGGMAIGADPITAAVITCAWQQGRELRGFIVRKEAKDHGTGQQVEGPVRPGDNAIIVEDVVTTGGSSLNAVQCARNFGLHVDRVIAIVDRENGGAERFKSIGIELTSLVKLSELQIA